MIKIIVSRYNEDIEWTKQYSNIIIYNKGTILDHIDNQIVLNNVGREGHTYYTYIYNNYDILDDYTIFLQGNPFDHSPNLVKNIQKYLDTKDLNFDFEFLSEYILSCTTTSGYNYDYMEDIFIKIFNKPSNDQTFIFGCGAQFIVSKKQILSRDKEFYLNIINILGAENDPIAGHSVERFHKLIFNSNNEE